MLQGTERNYRSGPFLLFIWKKKKTLSNEQLHELSAFQVTVITRLTLMINGPLPIVSNLV